MLFFTRRVALIRRRENEGKFSEETTAIKELTNVMLEFKKELSDNFIYTDENNNKVTPANFFRNINNFIAGVCTKRTLRVVFLTYIHWSS